MFRYNSTTEEFEGYSDGQWGSIGGSSNLNIDTMTGDGSDTTLTLSINPTVENNTQVYIDGVYQNKDTYSVSGTTLTFSTAPPAGSAVEVMTITPSVVSLLVPADGSVTPAKIASGDFYFDTNTLYVDSTNNRVGIGTASPSQALTVNGTDARIYLTGANTDIDMDASANGQLHLDGNAYGFGIALNASGANLYTNSVSRDLIFGVNETEVMRVTNSNVGIGTSSPEYNLDVTAADNVTTTTAISVQNSSRNYGLGLGAYTLTNRNIGGSATTVDYTFDIGRHAIFKTGNAERMRIDSVGNVIVGKTISGAGTQGFVVSPNGSIFSSISSGNTYHTYNTTNNLFTFYVGYTGGVINYQANNVNLSDEREKKNIEPLESKWDSVKSWSLKTFHYNHQEDESIKNYGVIAQDVEQTNPEAIDVYQKDENTERKGVKEQQMMWMAIKALQEAQARIETLETRIAALEE